MPPSRGVRSRSRRLVFVAFTALLLLGIVEAASYIAYRSMLDGAGPFDEVAERRDQIVRTGMSATDGRARPSSEEDVIHPFIGFADRAAKDGLCDKPHLIPRRDPARLRLLIVGGSVAHDFVRLGGSARLEQLLAASPALGRKPVETIYGGGYSYKQPQQLACYTYLLSQGASFDIVINIDGLNEVAAYLVSNDYQRKVYPAYPMLWAARLSSFGDRGRLRKRVRLVGLRERRRELAETFSGTFVLSSTATGKFIWSALDRARLGDIAEAELALGRHRSADEDYEATGPKYSFASRAQLNKKLAALWTDGSLQMHWLAKGNGARYYHFLQPNQYVAKSKPMSDDERGIAIVPGGPHGQQVRDGFPLLQASGAALATRGLRFHDLTMIFKDTAEQIYVDNCCHMNRRGKELMAEAIARAIVADHAGAPPGAPDEAKREPQ